MSPRLGIRYGCAVSVGVLFALMLLSLFVFGVVFLLLRFFSLFSFRFGHILTAQGIPCPPQGLICRFLYATWDGTQSAKAV